MKKDLSRRMTQRSCRLALSTNTSRYVVRKRNTFWHEYSAYIRVLLFCVSIIRLQKPTALCAFMRVFSSLSLFVFLSERVADMVLIPACHKNTIGLYPRSQHYYNWQKGTLGSDILSNITLLLSFFHSKFPRALPFLKIKIVWQNKGTFSQMIPIWRTSQFDSLFVLTSAECLKSQTSDSQLHYPAQRKF